MIYLLGKFDPNVIRLIGIVFAFCVNFFCITKFSRFLPKDQGRAFAVEGGLSEGKVRGVGFIFVLVYALSAFLFTEMSLELGIYLVLIIIEMLTGFFDDAAEKPWGEALKGILDFAVAVIVAVTYVYFNGSTVNFAIFGTSVVLPPVVYGILATILVWVSINVVNCTDGVDGLSATITTISLSTFFIISKVLEKTSGFGDSSLLFIAGLLVYLWYNSYPCTMLMGDAGSRAQGMMVAIAALKTGSPFLYLLVAIVFIVDGGLGLVKVSLLRFLKIRILKNTLTPIHDHVRKNKSWSNPQVVFRFAVLQIFVSAVTVCLICL